MSQELLVAVPEGGGVPVEWLDGEARGAEERRDLLEHLAHARTRCASLAQRLRTCLLYTSDAADEL